MRPQRDRTTTQTHSALSCVWDGGNALRVGAISEESKNAVEARHAASV